MRHWIENGVELAWLIDGENKCVYVYSKGREMRPVRDTHTIAGEGPVEGFILDLTDVWQGV